MKKKVESIADLELTIDTISVQREKLQIESARHEAEAKSHIERNISLLEMQNELKAEIQSLEDS
eukprot:1862231-Ditylum_brightwellii.AAC.1